MGTPDPGVSTARKLLHAGLSLGAAAAVFTLEALPAAVVLAAATAVALAVELARRTSPVAARAFRHLEGMLKVSEAGRLTGASTLSVGFTITAVLFPGAPTLAGILFAGLGDPAASLVGSRFGRVRYPGGKSLAGSAAFLFVVFGVALVLGLPPARALLVAGALTAVEAFTLPADDNLYLPLAGAIAVVLTG